jgi:hypothetical protein
MIPWSSLPYICSWIWHPVGVTEDIPVRIRNSFVPVDFMVLKMDVYHHIPLILGRPFLSTTGATIDVVARIIKLNISKKEETSTFKHKGTKKCNHVTVTITLKRNAMTPDKKQTVAENFSTKFSRRIKNATPSCDKISSHTSKFVYKCMEIVLLTDYKHEALAGR